MIHVCRITHYDDGLKVLPSGAVMKKFRIIDREGYSDCICFNASIFDLIVKSKHDASYVALDISLANDKCSLLVKSCFSSLRGASYVD